MARPRVDGKFLAVGNQRFYVKGVAYGAFAPNSQGDQFPEPPEVDRDFKLMTRAGINSILTYTVPPISLLDQAAEHGLRVVVNTPWMGHVAFLEERTYRKKVRKEVRRAIASCQQHPAILMYCIAKELPPQIVRWHGPRKVERFLNQLCQVSKDVDPEALVSYTNFPTTEYLELPFVDVFTFNVYLHHRTQFVPYIARLQHLAGELPLLLTEVGMCSLRHGEDGQADFLRWQMEEAFAQGAAGAMIFSWTDPFFQDGCLVEEWGFGLVDAERRTKPSFDLTQSQFTTRVPFPPGIEWPKISVVVALHNASETLDSCLAALSRMRYPNVEVIVVNDGSTDNSREIIEGYPSVRAIHQEQQGVSAARNSGMRAATGEIVAYIDSDADADPDWLFYLASTFLNSDVEATGGPNFVPAEDGWLAKCVYRSPGGPTHVMYDDRLAEHVPGCNMAFRKSALEAINGFDPVFRTAGDDVDLCWRLLEHGFRIGFSPSAVVWHHRRSSIRAYWRQQAGYGRAESLLERKFPKRFNPWGHAYWDGAIYAPYPTFRFFSEPTIYHGVWGSAGFQSMYDPGSSGMWGTLPRAMEWHLALLGLGTMGIFYPWALLLFAAGLAYTVFYCVVCAYQANVNLLEQTTQPVRWHHRLKWRAAIALLHVLEPLARDWGRLKGGLTPWRSVRAEAPSDAATSRWWKRIQPFRRSVQWTFPGGSGLERSRVLSELGRVLTSRGLSVGWNPDIESWDLKAGRGIMGGAISRLVVEHHGGPKRVVRFSSIIRPRPLVSWALLGCLALLLAAPWSEQWPAAAIFALSLVMLWMWPIVEAGRLEQALFGAAKSAIRGLDISE